MPGMIKGFFWGWGLKFSIPGFFGWGGGGIINNLKICGSARDSTTKLVLQFFTYLTHYIASFSGIKPVI